MDDQKCETNNVLMVGRDGHMGALLWVDVPCLCLSRMRRAARGPILLKALCCG